MKLPSEIETYLAPFPPERRQRIEQILRLFAKAHPEAEVGLFYNMPALKAGPHRWIAVANQKRYVSVYTCSEERIAPYLKAHPKTKHGKGCLNFPDSAEIDEKALLACAAKALG